MRTTRLAKKKLLSMWRDKFKRFDRWFDIHPKAAPRATKADVLFSLKADRRSLTHEKE